MSIDQCLFTKYHNGNLCAILCLYVDDILFTGKDKEIKYISNKLKEKYKISKDTEVNKIIGINIFKTEEGYKINQQDYIEKLIKNYKINKTKPINNPCRKITLKERENSTPVNVILYQ